MGKKYVQLNSGDSFEIKNPGGMVNFGCCDCGLVHNFAIVVNKDSIEFGIKRDNRRTGQRRRYNNFPMKGEWYG